VDKTQSVLVWFDQIDSHADRLGDIDRSEIVESGEVKDHF